MVAAGEAEAFATDDILLYGLIAQHRSQGQFKSGGRIPVLRSLRHRVPPQQAGCAPSVERAIRNLVVARDMGPLYDEMVLSSAFPNGERFNIPMSPQLERSSIRSGNPTE